MHCIVLLPTESTSGETESGRSNPARFFAGDRPSRGSVVTGSQARCALRSPGSLVPIRGQQMDGTT
jgi:hypothetical protein